VTTERNDRVIAAIRAAIEMATDVDERDVADFRERWLSPHRPHPTPVLLTLAVEGTPKLALALTPGVHAAHQFNGYPFVATWNGFDRITIDHLVPENRA
jgi:hypothetical protein